MNSRLGQGHLVVLVSETVEYLPVSIIIMSLLLELFNFNCKLSFSDKDYIFPASVEAKHDMTGFWAKQGI